MVDSKDAMANVHTSQLLTWSVTGSDTPQRQRIRANTGFDTVGQTVGVQRALTINTSTKSSTMNMLFAIYIDIQI
jgi:hypothetical protein